MRYISVDFGRKNFAYVIFQESPLRVIKYGVADIM